jgi:hypothetical protein
MESINIKREIRDIQSVKNYLKYDMMQHNCTRIIITLQICIVFEEYGFMDCDTVWFVRWLPNCLEDFGALISV